MSLTIDAMDLSPNAKRAAEIVQEKHPFIQFTSGRRGVYGQARAMAANVIRYGPSWLRDTYKDQRMVALLMTYTEEHLEQTSSIKLLASGYHDTLMEHYAGELTKFPHIRGDAFDIAWPMILGGGLIDRTKGDAIVKTIEQLPVELGLQLILKKEGRHEVIHSQFNHVVEV